MPLQKSLPIMQGSGARVEGCIHVSYLLPLHKGRSQSEDAKMVWILSFCVRWTITYLQQKCWWCVRTWRVTEFSSFFLLLPAAKLHWKKCEMYLMISWYDHLFRNLSPYYWLMNEKSWKYKEVTHYQRSLFRKLRDDRHKKSQSTWWLHDKLYVKLMLSHNFTGRH